MSESIHYLGLDAQLAGRTVRDVQSWSYAINDEDGVGHWHDLQSGLSHDEAIAILKIKVEEEARKTLHFLRGRIEHDKEQVETLHDALTDLSLERQRERVTKQREDRELRVVS